MIKSIHLLLISCASFLLLTCNQPAVQEPHFDKIEELKITKFKKRKMKLEGVMVFENPTTFDLKMDAIGIDIYYNGKKVDNVQMKHDHTMKAGTTYQQSFVSVVKSKEIIPLVYGTSWEDFKKDDLEIEIKGQALCKFQEKNYTMDMSYNQTIVLSKDGEEGEEEEETEVESKP